MSGRQCALQRLDLCDTCPRSIAVDVLRDVRKHLGYVQIKDTSKRVRYPATMRGA